MNGVNLVIQKTLDGLFSNLEQTLVMIVPQVEQLFKVMGHAGEARRLVWHK